jgi:hypothetical protein
MPDAHSFNKTDLIGGVYPLLKSSRLDFNNGQPTNEKRIHAWYILNRKWG